MGSLQCRKRLRRPRGMCVLISQNHDGRLPAGLSLARRTQTRKNSDSAQPVSTLRWEGMSCFCNFSLAPGLVPDTAFELMCHLRIGTGRSPVGQLSETRQIYPKRAGIEHSLAHTFYQVTTPLIRRVLERASSL